MNKSTVFPNGRIREFFLLTAAVLLYFFANFQRTAVPGAIFDELQTELDVNASMITGLGAMFMYVYALGQLFVGVLADKYGGYHVITFGGVLFCLGSMMFPFSYTLFFLYLSRGIVGVGASAIYLCLIKEVKRAYPVNFGPVMGVVMLIGYAGGMVANAPFVVAVHRIGWRDSLVYAGLLLAVITLIFLFLRFTVKQPEKTAVHFSIKAFRPAVSKFHNWAIYILTGGSFAIYYAFQTVLGKKFLEDHCAMKPVSAGWVLAASWVISALTNFGTPILCRFIGERRKPFMQIMGTGTLMCTVCMLLAVYLDFRASWFFTSVFLFLAFCSNMSPVFLMILSETNPPSVLGVCASFSNFIAYFLIALVGNISGPLMDLFDPQLVDGIRVYGKNSYIAVFLVYMALALVGQFFALQIRETYGKDTEVS